MGDYLRETRECTLDNMTPALSQAIQQHLERYGMEDVVTDLLMGIETRSTKAKKGLFRAKTEVVITAVLLTPTWLIWASGKEGDKPGALSARLDNIRVQDYEKSSMYKLAEDTGLNVTGMLTDGGESSSVFIGLGPETAAQIFRTQLIEAMTKV